MPAGTCPHTQRSQSTPFYSTHLATPSSLNLETGSARPVEWEKRWHRSMETAKSHQLLRPCFEQRVGPDGFQTVPNCEVSSQGETKPQTSPGSISLREKNTGGRPQGHPGGTAGKSHAPLQPFPRGDSASSLWSSGKQKQRREDGAGQTSSHHFVFWPGKCSRSQELLPTWEKRKGWVKKLWHRAALQAQLIHSRTSALWMIFWQGTRVSFC